MRRFALLLFAGVPSLLGAQGFGVYEHGSCAMGRAGTGVAAPCADGSAPYFNPAALVGGSRIVSLGGTVVRAFGGFTDDVFAETTDLEDKTILIPHVFITYPASPKLGLGFGVFVPYGLETNWPTSFEARFSGYRSRIQEVYLQPTVAYQATPWLSLGLGVDVVVGDLELNQRADLSAVVLPTSLGVPPGTTFSQFGIPRGTDFADAHLEASGTAVTAHFGALVKFNDRVSLGARYLVKADVDYDGDAVFEPVATGLVIPADITVGSLTLTAGTPVDAVLASLGVFNTVLADGPASTEVTNPDQLIVGVAYRFRDDLTLLADYQLVRWSHFRTIALDFANAATPDRTLYESYRDTHGFRFGSEWRQSEKLTLRGGYLYHTAAAPPQTVTPLLPEGSRNEVTLGAGFRLGARLHADVAYQYVKQNDRRGRLRDSPDGSPPTVALNSGVYDFGAHLFGVTFAYTF